MEASNYLAMESPINWHLENLRSDGKASLKEALAKRKSLEEGKDLFWRLYAINLTIAFEEYDTKNYENALHALTKCEDNVQDLRACGDPLHSFSPEALHHVIASTRGFILSAMPGLETKGRTLLEETIVQFKEDIKGTAFQSAIIGIRSAVFMSYGVAGTAKAKEYIGEALKLDINVAEWHFLYGKCLGRLRRIFTYTDQPSAFELKHHTLAVTLSNREVGYYLVYLAQCQRESGFRLSRNGPDGKTTSKEVDELFEASVKNYHKAYEMSKDCSHVGARCALGFLKLPDPYGDRRFAHEIMEKTIRKCPINPMFQHTWGLINERGIHDNELALSFYQRAAKQNLFGAWMDLIRLTYLEHKNAYNPTQDLIGLMTIFPEDHLKDKVLVQIGSFYLFQCGHLCEALDYYTKILEKDPESQDLRTHRSIFLALGRNINLIPVIFDECRLKCAIPKTSELQKKKCRKMIVMLTFLKPELCKFKPKSHRRELLDESFKYTHPWFKLQQRKVKDPEETKSRSRSPTKRVASRTQKKEAEFTPYIPNPDTILRGWLSAEEQLAKKKSRENWKARTKRGKDVQGETKDAREASLKNEKEGEFERKRDWRKASLTRDSSTDTSPVRSLNSSYFRRGEQAREKMSNSHLNWRSDSRSRDSSMEYGSPPVLNSHDNYTSKGRGAYDQDWRSRSCSHDATVRRSPSQSSERCSQPGSTGQYRPGSSQSLHRTHLPDPATNWRRGLPSQTEAAQLEMPVSSMKRLSLEPNTASFDQRNDSGPRATDWAPRYTSPSERNLSTSPDSNKQDLRYMSLGNIRGPRHTSSQLRSSGKFSSYSNAVVTGSAGSAGSAGSNGKASNAGIPSRVIRSTIAARDLSKPWNSNR